MRFEDVMAAIPDEPAVYRLAPDAVLHAWCGDAMSVFQSPPTVPPEHLFEAVGRHLALHLHHRLKDGDYLPPSPYRLGAFLKAAIKDVTLEQEGQADMWAEIICHYLGEMPRALERNKE